MEGYIVKYLLILFMTGQSASVGVVDFDSMQACQNAKTVIMAANVRASEGITYPVFSAYCFPAK